MKEYKILACELRKDCVDIIMTGGGHIGGDMSVMEILLSLYFQQMNIDPQNMDDPNRDRFILSKGHAMEAYYAVLAKRGFLDLQDIIQNFSKYQSPYIGHPNNKLAGIEVNSGSLGHGLPVAVGMAMAAKMDERTYRVYTVMGDGELAEGSVWEGAMCAGHYKLDNLCAVVDRNRLQISGCTEDVMAHDSLQERFSSFGWNVLTINGNDLEEVNNAFDTAKITKGKPTMIIAETTKGCGSSIMENKANWYHKVPTMEEYNQIIADFNKRKEMLINE